MEWIYDWGGGHNLTLILIFFARFVGITSLELAYPARNIPYRKIFLSDLATYGVFQFVILPLTIKIQMHLISVPPLSKSILALPLTLRFVLYLVIADFGHYWVHRFMHTKWVWRIHKWHHYPKYMWWLAGNRGTVPHLVLLTTPFLLAGSLLQASPWWMAFTFAILYPLQNDWMHANLNWRLSRLEWIFVTPQYHHIHHSDNPSHYKANLGGLFTWWDRLFGTYVNPGKLKEDLSFGIGEKVSPIRLVLGI